MKITIIATGKLSTIWRGAAQEYRKRIESYCKLEIVELSEEKAGAKLSNNDVRLVLNKEGERILRAVAPASYLCAMDLKGASFSSEAFAEWLGSIRDESRDLCFLVGSHLGLSKTVLDRCDKSISFSPMTFPHQLARILLLEQLYRGFTILNRIPYHK